MDPKHIQTGDALNAIREAIVGVESAITGVRTQLERQHRGPRWTVHLTYHPGKDNMRAWDEWFARYGLPSGNDIVAATDLVFDSDSMTLSVQRFVRGDKLLKEMFTVVVRGPLEPFPPGHEVTVD